MSTTAKEFGAGENAYEQTDGTFEVDVSVGPDEGSDEGQTVAVARGRTAKEAHANAAVIATALTAAYAAENPTVQDIEPDAGEELRSLRAERDDLLAVLKHSAKILDHCGDELAENNPAKSKYNIVEQAYSASIAASYCVAKSLNEPRSVQGPGLWLEFADDRKMPVKLRFGSVVTDSLKMDSSEVFDPADALDSGVLEKSTGIVVHLRGPMLEFLQAHELECNRFIRKVQVKQTKQEQTKADMPPVPVTTRAQAQQGVAK